MQMFLTLAAEKPLCIPINYNYQLQSSIYSKLAELGLSDFWHDDGFGEDQTFKMFTFSPLCGTYRIIDKKICFEGEIAFEIRSPIFEFCDELQRCIEMNPSIKLFDTKLNIINASLTNRHINEGSAIFSAASPIIVHSNTEDRKTEFYFPHDDCFIERLIKNYKNKYESVYTGDAPDIDIEIVNEGKKVVTNYKGIWLNGNKCELAVKGNWYALEFLYDSGFGEKNSQGFGFVNLK